MKYYLRQEIGEPHVFPEIELEQQDWFCCQVMKDHIKAGDFWADHATGILEIQSYDHTALLIKFCFNCGQEVSIWCLGKQMMKRDEHGVLNVKVGGLIQI